MFCCSFQNKNYSGFTSNIFQRARTMCRSPPLAISQVINYSSAGILLIFTQPAVLSQDVSTQTERSRIFHDRQVIFKISALTAYSPFHYDDITSPINQGILYNSQKKTLWVESLCRFVSNNTNRKPECVSVLFLAINLNHTLIQFYLDSLTEEAFPLL